MWFDAHAKLAEITGGTPATSATTATPQAETPRRVAEVASVAAPQRQKPQTARADGLDPDAGALLDFLHIHGPSSYGAAATVLDWGVTRAWRAEAKLRAGGFVRLDSLGRAYPADHIHERNA